MTRPLTVNYPDRGQTEIYYGTQYSGTYAEIAQAIASGQYRYTYVWSDGLGRKARVAVTNGEPLTYNETLNTCFSGSGLVSLQGYPFQDDGWSSPISCSVAGDSYTYDALGRVTKLTHADGSYKTWVYSGSSTTITDEAGVVRILWADGLGRLTYVGENPAGLNYVTKYGYDALNNLTVVQQNTSQYRYFSYDGLSRITSSTNPETGNWAYSYDADSNVQTRVDARGITTTYAYDALDRLTSKTYSDGVTPTAEYFYDATTPWHGVTFTNTTGRLVGEGTYNGTWLSGSCFSYDAMGRIINNSQQVPITQSSAQYVTYQYDLIGDITSYLNGAGVTFGQLFNPAGLPTQLTSNWVDSQHPATLASNLHYGGNGALTSGSLGNGLAESAAFNGLLQPCRLNVNSSGTLVSSCTASVPSGNLLDLSYGFNYGTGDNGNLRTWSAAGQQSFNRSYNYDAVNRLSTMSAPGNTCSGLSWTYDAWGNRTAQNATGGTCNTSALTINSNNQMASPYQYDANGNLTYDGVHSYTYDAENHITKVDGGNTATYTYDAEGRRVSRIVGSVETDYVRDLSGNVLVEYGGGCGSTCAYTQYIYLNSQLKALYKNSTTYFVHRDHLGSTRLVTALNQSIVDNLDYLPFGEQIAGDTTTTHKFTGYERDTESGNDYAMARFYSSRPGRFMTPDPAGNSVADLTNPQSWNMYAYALNSPLDLVDPSGLDCLYFNDAGNGVESIDHNSTSGECADHGGDWVNGTVDERSISYNAQTDMFSVKSSDVFYSYSQTLSAPGPQTNGGTCSEDCSYSYSQSFAPNISMMGQELNSMIHSRPWLLSFNVPFAPAPGVAGVGAAGSASWNPKTGTVCLGLGLGVSGGRTISGGQLSWGQSWNGQDYPSGADNILKGNSWSVGANTPVGIGPQVTANGAGMAGGIAVGVPGASASVTHSWCF